MARWLSIVTLCLALGACAAIGNTVNVRQAKPDLTTTTAREVTVRVTDLRPEVVSGKRGPEWVGYNRDSYGIPHDIETRSGKGFADEMAVAIVAALKFNGVSARLASKDAPIADREIRVFVDEWNSATVFKTFLHYSVRAEVYDKTGTMLAGNAAHEDVSFNTDLNPEKYLLINFKIIIAYLLNDQKIISVL